MTGTVPEMQVCVLVLPLIAATFVLTCAPANAAEGASFQGDLEERLDCPVQEVDSFSEPVSFRKCDSGGRGSKSCETGEGINPMGVHDGCGISCQEGYYACCRRGNLFSDSACFCVRAPRWPYTPAFTFIRESPSRER